MTKQENEYILGCINYSTYRHQYYGLMHNKSKNDADREMAREEFLKADAELHCLIPMAVRFGISDGGIKSAQAEARYEATEAYNANCA